MTREIGARQVETVSSLRVEHIVRALIAGLREGKYLPGQRIRDKDIADAFGVSRTPAREALGWLRSRGLIEMAPGGLAIRTLSPPEVIQLYTVRQTLEGLAAKLAAQHASEVEISAMEHLVSALGDDAKDPQSLAKINREFHRAIWEAAHNEFLANTLDELEVVLYLLRGTTYEMPGRAKQAYFEHLDILAALKSRAPDAAEAAARHHLQQAQQARLSARPLP